jgi:hypothetical protein
LADQLTTKKPKKLRVDKAQASKKRKRPDGVMRKGHPESLPTSVQKSYFLLSAKEREKNLLSINVAAFSTSATICFACSDSGTVQSSQ